MGEAERLLERVEVFALEIFDEGQFELRLRAPAGTRIEATEQIANRTLQIIGQEVGKDNVEISVGYVGVQSAAYPGAAALGRGLGYDYPHELPGQVSDQELMPDRLAGTRFYQPGEAEAALRERLEEIRRARGR